MLVDCKTGRIFACSNTRELSNRRSGTRLKTESETGERLKRCCLLIGHNNAKGFSFPIKSRHSSSHWKSSNKVRYAGLFRRQLTTFDAPFLMSRLTASLSSADGLTFNPESVSTRDLAWLTVSNSRGNPIERKCWLVPSTLDLV